MFGLDLGFMVYRCCCLFLFALFALSGLCCVEFIVDILGVFWLADIRVCWFL